MGHDEEGKRNQTLVLGSLGAQSEEAVTGVLKPVAMGSRDVSLRHPVILPSASESQRPPRPEPDQKPAAPSFGRSRANGPLLTGSVTEARSSWNAPQPLHLGDEQETLVGGNEAPTLELSARERSAAKVSYRREADTQEVTVVSLPSVPHSLQPQAITVPRTTLPPSPLGVAERGTKRGGTGTFFAGVVCGAALLFVVGRVSASRSVPPAPPPQRALQPMAPPPPPPTAVVRPPPLEAPTVAVRPAVEEAPARPLASAPPTEPTPRRRAHHPHAHRSRLITSQPF